MKGYFRKLLIGLLAVVIVAAALFFWVRYELKQDATLAFNQNSIVKEHLGEVTIEELGLSQFSAQPQCQDGCEHYLVTLEGEKASATAVMDFAKGDTELSNAILCLADGTNIALTEDAVALVQNNTKETHCQ
ncbi:TPA: hypothetical protein ACSTLY_001568 [Serratia fonticola]|uniref:Transmembrane protein n=1 Tax=Serratia fonticola TaxID=47917 RepID=A0A3S4X637_SERFO|nr:hypothetical protein [Serratia fonticola]CAI0899205.1 Uncharacterised protein [Serratia fonticola]CAI1828006.1 Uncharacterised protein [Serratia fonticola]CAI1920420.1 Uncharacterised protein [Serratia fonticola]VEI66326.1 Uncharacterised protein [Serratia fonticola]